VAEPRGRWIVFTDRTGVGDALAAELEQQGARVTRVVPGDAFAARGANTFQINPVNRDDYQRLWSPAEGAADADTRAIHLWSLDAEPVDRTTARRFEAGLVDSVSATAYLVQALVAAGVARPALWIVTRGAVMTEPGVPHAPIAIEGAALWGFGRSIALEHPDIWGGLIDVSLASPTAAARAIVSELGTATPDDQVAHADRGRSVARLVRRPADRPAKPVTLAPDGVYLVTGGVGALGLAAAQWLVDAGARHVVLVSRRAEASESARLQMAALEARGATVETRAADVSRPEDVDHLLTLIAARRPLRGVVHAAGVDDPASISALDPARIRAALAGKATGAWILHERTRARDLDLFVCFSSMAGVVGAQSRAHYGAANAVLDGLMAERSRLGLAAISVAWGPWSGGGMATSETLRDFERAGNHALEPAAARAALGRAVASGAAHVLVADVEWPVFRQALEMRRPRPLLDALAPTPGAPTAAVTTTAPWIEQLRAVPSANRERELTALLQRELAATMGFDDEASVPVDRNFYEIGVDSLMMADLVSRLRSRTGVAASALVFNHPNVSALAGQLLPQLPLANDRESDGATIEPSHTATVEAEPEVQSDTEILEFQAQAFPDRRPELVPARWRWMFIDSARRVGVRSRFWIHREDGRIVAQMGSIPVRLHVNGRELATGWLVDTMVLEPYRHLAIGARLMVEAHENQPFSLSLGQTAEMREIQFRLGWTQVAPVQIAQLLVRPENVLKGKLPAPAAWAAGLGIRASSLVREWRHDAPALAAHSIDRFDERHDVLWREASRDVTCAVVRDASYLNWKYVDQPGQRFVRLDVRDGDTLVGTAVWMLREPDGPYRYRRAFLVDLVTSLSQPARLRNVLSVACAEASRWEVDALLCHHIDERLTEALRNCGFHLRRPERYLLVDAGSLAPEARATVLSRQGWFVTHGDSDIDRP
jgi:NAD(P)-dependent dehydrogenase (short-subunit alcohol dehydrogenase family)